jgi:hypothetical protein
VGVFHGVLGFENLLLARSKRVREQMIHPIHPAPDMFPGETKREGSEVEAPSPWQPEAGDHQGHVAQQTIAAKPMRFLAAEFACQRHVDRKVQLQHVPRLSSFENRDKAPTSRGRIRGFLRR